MSTMEKFIILNKIAKILRHLRCFRIIIDARMLADFVWNDLKRVTGGAWELIT